MKYETKDSSLMYNHPLFVACNVFLFPARSRLELVVFQNCLMGQQASSDLHFYNFNKMWDRGGDKLPHASCQAASPYQREMSSDINYN